jgi:hypothetical protein
MSGKRKKSALHPFAFGAPPSYNQYVGAAGKARVFKILQPNTDDSKWARGNYHGNLK